MCVCVCVWGGGGGGGGGGFTDLINVQVDNAARLSTDLILVLEP